MFSVLCLNVGSVYVNNVTKNCSIFHGFISPNIGENIKSIYEKIKGYRHMEFGEYLIPFTLSPSCLPASGSIKNEIHGTVFYLL